MGEINPGKIEELLKMNFTEKGQVKARTLFNYWGKFFKGNIEGLKTEIKMMKGRKDIRLRIASYNNNDETSEHLCIKEMPISTKVREYLAHKYSGKFKQSILSLPLSNMNDNDLKLIAECCYENKIIESIE
jgi:hypothetical protein